MSERVLDAPSLRIGPREFAWGARTYVMGVINVSPESFSGDGVASAEDAVALARRFSDEGADILDIGGQSTRPGAEKSEAGFDELTPDEEIRRVVPAIERIRAALPEMPVSVDTYKPQVARAAIDAGAHMLNDIEGLRRHPEIADIIARAGVPVVVMHNQRGRSAADVMAAIIEGLRESLRIAQEGGLPRDRVIVDPGFGFGWRPEQNIEMLRRLRELEVLRLPVMIGTSRKSTIGAVLGGAPVEDRLFGTAATVALAIANGADIVRVHDVRAMKQVVRAADAVVRGWRPDGRLMPPRGRGARVFLGLGANLGDRERNLREGVRRIGERCRVVAVSSLYESQALVAEGDPPGPDYLNAACEIETVLAPQELAAFLRSIELDLGRDAAAKRWAARPIDIDILLYGDDVIETASLVVPHPAMCDRPFVLVPLSEIAPDVVHPALGRSIGDLARDADLPALRRAGGPAWAGDL